MRNECLINGASRTEKGCHFSNIRKKLKRHIDGTVLK